MKTLGEVYNLSVQFLEQKKIERSKFLVQALLTFVMGIDKLSLFMSFETPLQEVELSKIREYLSQIAKGKPIEQILGVIDFFDCRIFVSEDVLIPRPETEILVDMLAKEISENAVTVWDVCCGSGCLGISLKKKFSHLSVTLSDISSKALGIAKVNARRNNVSVNFLQGDLLEPYKSLKADLVICNPPYLSQDEYDQVDLSVKDYEPKIALVGGFTGLEFYQRLAEMLPHYLNPGAKVYFEIGCNQGNDVLDIFSSPVWRKKRLLNDWAGHDRFFFLEIE
ncbi:MAG: peptide chain release factor N(5)-glutamine methyltransferase [Chlamydiae bacterium]|nr:peptide chain release factor N(5)-glutamine methyltransferase [Chlamydiota bacterium]